MTVFTHRIRPDDPSNRRLAESESLKSPAILALTAEERTRSRFRYVLPEGAIAHLQLPRGTHLQDGDLVATETEDMVLKIVAKPEPVMTVTADTSLDLLRAAYHLGNRHVPLEVNETYLRLAPDSVLQAMLVEQLGVWVTAETVPFKPETGAYHHGHH